MSDAPKGAEDGSDLDPFSLQRKAIPSFRSPDTIDKIVVLLAQGLELLYSRVCDGRSIVRQDEDTPTVLQAAQSYIARLYIEEGKREGISADLHALIALCKKPFCDPVWGLDAFAAEDWKFRDVILVDAGTNAPTNDCSTMATSYNGFGENEIVQHMQYKALMSLASQCRDKEKAYSLMRELAGRSDNKSQSELLDFFKEHEMRNIGNLFIQHFYEPCPESWLDNGKAYRCPHCGSLMRRKNAKTEWRCTLTPCASLNIPQQPVVFDTLGEPFYVAKPSVRKYWIEPAFDELKIYDAARAIGIENVNLYPFCDAVDIEFLLSEYGVDVKSYISPEVLAMHFIKDGIGRLRLYKKKIVAISETSRLASPRFKERLIRRLHEEGDNNPAKGVEILYVEEVISRLIEIKAATRK